MPKPIQGKLSLEQLWQVFNHDGDKTISKEEAAMASGGIFGQFIVEENMTLDVFLDKNKDIYKQRYVNEPMSPEEAIFTEMHDEANMPKKGSAEDSILQEMIENANKPTRASEKAILEDLQRDMNKK